MSKKRPLKPSENPPDRDKFIYKDYKTTDIYNQCEDLNFNLKELIDNGFLTGNVSCGTYYGEVDSIEVTFSTENYFHEKEYNEALEV